MKKFASFCLLMSLGFLIFLAGCTEKADTTVNATRADYIGRWSVRDSTLKSTTYEVQISSDPASSDGVLISNFDNLGWSVPAAGAVVKGNSITLDANQVIQDQTINGYGTLSGTKINWHYTVSTGADLSTRGAVYTKK